MADKASPRKPTGKNTAPAEGERRAIRGYSFQHRVSAKLIRTALTEGALEWIRVADPKAGRLDDLQIGRDVRIDAYQMKGSQFTEAFSFLHLTKPQGTAPSLIAQLADGWKQLRVIHAPRRVVVHLVTNDYPSTNDDPPTGTCRPAPHHFAAFLAEAWKPSQETNEDERWICPPVWQATWDALWVNSGLTVEEFTVFVRDCELNFGFTLPDESEDLKALQRLLFDTVADDERIVHLSRQELLQALGWTARYEFRSQHNFPVDQALYSPIEETVSCLELALRDLPGGYIGLLGTPGSGKSTLLTQTLRPRANRRVIRYYAYVPDAQDPTSLRGESVSFLHDITLALEQAGFQTGEIRRHPDRAELLNVFHKLLGLLHEDWKRTGHSTVILVDGLDHIPREQNPSHSLLLDLPLPNQIPEGVYIVLGTQTNQLSGLSGTIKREIEKPERRIEMTSLRREAVFLIAESAALPFPLDSSLKEDLYVRSAGHPLALSYLLNRLRSVPSAGRATELLVTTLRYEGNIRNQYENYWEEISPNETLAKLLGLLARLRREIDIDWVRSWADSGILKLLWQSTAHYFRIDERRWRFFHNSFRLFLVEKTSEVFGGHEKRIDRNHHLTLAEHCHVAPHDSPWHWEELYHRVEGGDFPGALALATQQGFREQFYALRPAEAILTDIRVALRAASATQDAVAFTRLALAGSEIAERSTYLEDQSLYLTLLFDLGPQEAGLEALRDGNQLRVTRHMALHCCHPLKARGLDDEARLLFELSQPLDLLDPSASPLVWNRDHDNIELLRIWIEAAIHFRPVTEIIELIRQRSADADRVKRRSKQQASRILQNELLRTLGEALIENDIQDGFENVLSALTFRSPNDATYLLDLYIFAWRHHEAAGDHQRAMVWLEKAISRFTGRKITVSAYLAWTEGVFRIQGDTAKAINLAKNISMPMLPQFLGIEAGFAPFQPLFTWRRLLYALGDSSRPSDIIPDAKGDADQGMVYFQRAVCVVADIWGEAWKGNRLDANSVRMRLHGVLALFHRDRQETRSRHSWLSAEYAREEFYPLLVDAVAQHGPEALDALCTEFEALWLNPATSTYWPIDVIRAILRAVWKNRYSRDWTTKQLHALEAQMLEGQDIAGRVKQFLEQADVWLALGETDWARTHFTQALEGTFGVGYRKDYQMDTWINWMERFNTVEPTFAPERIAWLARAIVSLGVTTEGKASYYAARSLLVACIKWSPQRTVHLFAWLLQQGNVWHADALSVVIQEAVRLDVSAWRLGLACLRHIVLTVADSAYPELARALIEAASKDAGSSGAKQAAISLLAAVSIQALPSTRKEWRYGISWVTEVAKCNPNEVGLSSEDLEMPDGMQASLPQMLTLKDDSILSVEEIRAQTKSLSAVTELMSLQSPVSSFSWSPVVATVIASQGRADVERFIEALPSYERTPNMLGVLAGQLQNLGVGELTWNLRLEALHRSNVMDWVRRYDGGSRLEAARALVVNDKVKGRVAVYSQLFQDLSSRQISFSSIAESLNDLLPLLTDDIDVAAIRPYIDEHVRELFETSRLPADDIQERLSLPLNEPDSIAAALADLITFHLGHSIIPLSDGALRACTDPLIATNSDLLVALERALMKSAKEQASALIVLDTISETASDSVRPLSKAIEDCTSSRSFLVRKIADRIGTRLGLQMPLLIRSGQFLPPIYRIGIELTRSPRVVGAPDASYSPLPESVDPFAIVSPFHRHLCHIALEAGLEEVNVVVRCTQIMRELDEPSNWSAVASEQAKNRYSSSALEFTFRRRKTQIAREALFCVVQELVQAGKLRETHLNRLHPLLRVHDPWFTRIAPILRPERVEPISGLDWHEPHVQAWCERTPNAFGSMKKVLSDGRIILAERTILKNLAWGAPSETRFSKVSIHPFAFDFVESSEDEGAFFENIRVGLLQEYPHKTARDNPISIEVENEEGWMLDTPGVNWLALNPSLARALNWKPDSIIPLRWNDQEGRIVVESVWWMDSHLHWLPPHLDDEVGEGWLVIATPEAYEAIKAVHGELIQIARISRSYISKDKQRRVRATSMKL